MDESQHAWLRWIRLRGISYANQRRLLNHFGSPAAVFTAERSDLLVCLGGNTRSLNALLQTPDAEGLARDRQWLQEPCHHLLPISSAKYPELLKQIADPPQCLFVRGDPHILDYPQIAIVGSRNPTASGVEITHHLAKILGGYGITVTSGLAIGIDAAAHQGALQGHGLTVAVAATGPDTVYPQRHRELAERIEHNGAVITEFATGTPPKREFFPRRNRIISGLAKGVLVVEAAARSGSLITARLAGEQGREVFAIPGPIHSPNSKGCHALIRQGAKLVETVDDILEELGDEFTQSIRQSLRNKQSTEDQSEFSNTLIDPTESLVFDAVDYTPAPIDTLIERCGLTANTVSSILLQLELKGLVQTSRGGYVRTAGYD